MNYPQRCFAFLAHFRLLLVDFPLRSISTEDRGDATDKYETRADCPVCPAFQGFDPEAHAALELNSNGYAVWAIRNTILFQFGISTATDCLSALIGIKA